MGKTMLTKGKTKIIVKVQKEIVRVGFKSKSPLRCSYITQLPRVMVLGFEFVFYTFKNMHILRLLMGQMNRRLLEI